MGLIGNYTISAKSPARRFSGTGAGLRDNTNTPGSSRAMFVGYASIGTMSAVPRGYRPGAGSWILSMTSGDMSSVNELTATFSNSTPILIAGRNLDGTATITFSSPPIDLQLVVSAAGSATLTFSGGALLAGALSGSGSATLTFSDSTPLLGAVADLTATGTVTFSGVAAVTAIGELIGVITPFTELSPENLANSVWSQVLDSGFTAGDIMTIISATVAGKTSGQPLSPVFRNLGDTATVVSATVDTSGNRTSVTVTP